MEEIENLLHNMVNISTNSINSECCGFAPNIEYIFHNDRCTTIAIIAKTT